LKTQLFSDTLTSSISQVSLCVYPIKAGRKQKAANNNALQLQDIQQSEENTQAMII
jgi:hypothetical protein